MKLKNIRTICSAYHCIILLLYAVVCTQYTNAQQLLWQRVFDTGVEDFARGITTDKWGNIIVTGISALQTSSGGCLTIKYSQDGDTIWTQWYDFNPHDIVTDNLGNVILGGDIGQRIAIIKCDPNGKIVWTRTYSSGEDIGEFGYGVAVDSKNNIIVTGTAYYNLGDYMTIKYDSSGNLLWMRTYNGMWEDYAQDVAVDDSDNIIVTGYSDSGMNWDWCTIKYNTEGDTLWVRRYDVSLDDWSHGVACDREGNILVVGQVRPVYRSRGAVVKYNQHGDTLWTRIFSDPLEATGVEEFVDIVRDDNDNMILLGNYVRWDSTKRFADYFIAKCAPNGDTLWTFRYDYDNEEDASGIALDRDGNIVVTGTANRSPQVYEQNYLTIKIRDLIDLIEDKPFLPREFLLYPNYPNPFNPSTTISYQLLSYDHVTLKLFDVLGREVKILVNANESVGQHVVRWDGTDQRGYHVPSGVYYYRLTTSHSSITKKAMLIR